MLKIILKKIQNFLLNFIKVQLIVTLVALPILISWGLTISKASFLGNLIFTPILMLFLILSSLILFTQLIGIDNNIFIYLLDQTRLFWEKILSLSNQNWITGFKCVNYLILLCIPIITISIIYNKKLNSELKKILSLATLLTISLCYFYIQDNFFTKTQEIKFGHNKNYLIIKQDNQKTLTIEDFGYLANKKNLDNFLNFEIKPFIIKNYGKSNIDYLIFHKRPKTFISCQFINKIVIT